VIEISLIEKESLGEFFRGMTPLRSAITKFCQAKVDASRADCADFMSMVPCDPEQAKRYAHKAETYKEFLSELEALSNK